MTATPGLRRSLTSSASGPSSPSSRPSSSGPWCAHSPPVLILRAHRGLTRDCTGCDVLRHRAHARRPHRGDVAQGLCARGRRARRGCAGCIPYDRGGRRLPPRGRRCLLACRERARLANTPPAAKHRRRRGCGGDAERGKRGRGKRPTRSRACGVGCGR
ncbi:hypothetical protein BC834DRAFT_652353 [Gloeopeniophorella convolvens]|nr:hypothetical protein BC834DRAFT_652353 [Gloeopeniophorella convolvens]